MPEKRRQGRIALDSISWAAQERSRGYVSPPDAAEFNDINEYMTAKNMWREIQESHKHKSKETATAMGDMSTPAREVSEGNEDEIMLDSGTEEESIRGMRGLGQTKNRRAGGNGQGTGTNGSWQLDRGEAGELDDDAGSVGTRPSRPSPSGVRQGAATTIMQMKRDNKAVEAIDGEGRGESEQLEQLLGASPVNLATSIPSQGNPLPHLSSNLNRKFKPLSLSNFTAGEGSDNLSLSLDIDGGSEGGGMRRRREHVPAHLAPMIREWLKEQRESNGYLPNSPLRPRPPKNYDGRSGGPTRLRGNRFSPYHSIERLIAIPGAQLGQDLNLDATHEASTT